MPDPSNYSSEDEWMAACVPAVEAEGKPHDAAVGQCLGMWRERSVKQDFIFGLAQAMGNHRKLDGITRAYSVLTVKSFDAEQRTIEGIASTPTVDRIGDVVEPMGAKFNLPIPLLWQHKSDQPVGHVMVAKATKDGISIRAKLAKIEESGELKNLVDKAWQAVKAGLVRGLSIGFQPEADGVELLESKTGFRFTKWSWLELSLVTIPANMEATITTVKSIDADLRAALGREEIGVTGGLAAAKPSRPGAAGKATCVNLKAQGARDMSKTITEQIAALEAKRSANEARMAEVLQKAADEDRSTDEAEQEEFDSLQREVEAIDADLRRFKTLEKLNLQKAKPVSEVKSVDDGAAVRGGGSIRVRGPQLPPGIRLARVVKCLGMARGNRMEAAQIAKQLYSDDQGVVNILEAGARYGELSAEVVTKAAVEAGGTNTWAGFLVGDETSAFADFAEFLRPMTILGKFGNNGIPALRRVPFRVPLLTQTTGGDGYWVGEGQAKGVTKFDGTRTTLEPLKAANIAVLTEEVVRDSSPSAEVMVRDQLAAALRQRIDTDFIDPSNAGAAGSKPASITNSATPISSSGVTGDAVRADIAAIMQPFIDADNPPTSGVWIMSASTALQLSLMQNTLGQSEFPGITMNGGTFAGLPVIVSEFVGTSGGSPNTRYVWLVNASDVYLGDDGGVSVDMSREASLQMDSAPTNASLGAGSPSEPVPTTLVSLWQTNSIGFRAERTINWALRRSTAVQGLSGVVWGT